jgi:hypothetical protein
MPIANPMAVLPVKGIPRLVIVFVIGRIAAAAPVLLPKIEGIDSPAPPVDVALVAAVVIVDKGDFFYKTIDNLDTRNNYYDEV